ncbi:MAG: hypothetical protein GHCLOJNM_02113 [bacterium]|nr:hypothetical protein [bacterium]
MKSLLRPFLLLIAVGSLSAAAQPTDPAIELSGFKVQEGLEVNCFAHEPMVVNPIQTAFDSKGRLWAICSYSYPQITPGERPHDTLVILEDTDRDGTADKSTVFYEGLLVPTGFEFGDGGVYVANPPDLLFLKDTDGDDVADEKHVVLSGFGTEDNHHAISAWKWSPGGLLHFMSGIFLHTQVETPHGVVRLNDGGVFEFQPRKLKLGLWVQQGFANPWGLAFDRWGQDFLTEAPGGNIFYLLPGQVNTKLRGDYPLMPGAPKSCGIEFVSGAHWPEDWQGDMILNAFKNRVVHRYKFSEDSSGFSAKEMEPLVVSTEEYFRPVDVKMGPDGAIYIADWYNPIIGHMQYNFRDPRRDKTHGRIWRITRKGEPLLQPPVYEGKSIAEILEYLKSPVDYERHHARRVLYDLDPDRVETELREWTAALEVKDPEFEHHRLEALWTHQTIDRANPALLEQELTSADPRARAAAVRVLRYWLDRVEEPLALLERAVRDEHPRVRLEAVVALSFVPDPRSIEIATLAVYKPMDRYLEFALRNTAIALERNWMPSFEAGETTFGGDSKRLSFALQAVRSEGAVRPLLNILKKGEASPERREQILLMVAALGGPRELAELLAPTLYTSQPEPKVQPIPDTGVLSLQARVFAELRARSREREVRPDNAAEALRAYLTHEHSSLASEALRLAGAWKLEELRNPISEIALSASRSAEVRGAAAEALGDLGGEAGGAILERLAGVGEPKPLRLAAVRGLIGVDLGMAAELGARLLADLTPGDPNPAELLAAFRERKGGGEALGAALAASVARQPLDSDVAKLALRHLYSVGAQDQALIQVLTQSAGITASARELNVEEMKALLAEIAEKGDPEKGEAVFRRADLSCLQCHAIAGGGGQVAPDLAGIGVSSQPDYLVDSILAPGKAVREGYAAQLIETIDGASYHGTLLRETENEVVLRDQVEDEIPISKDDIENRRDTGSLMPNGLADLLTRSELVDLVRFLSELGKSGPYSTPNIPVVRRWRVLERVAEMPAGSEPDPLEGVLSEGGPYLWTPAYGKVSGILPAEDFGGDESAAFARCEVEVTSPGEVRFELNSAEGLSLWVDNSPVEVSKNTLVTLERGIRQLTFRIDKKARGAKGLLLLAQESPGSAGRVLVVNGK